MSTLSEPVNVDPTAPPLTQQEFESLTRITEQPAITEAEFRERIRLEVPQEIPLRTTQERLTNEEIEDLVRNPVLRPDVIQERQQLRLNSFSKIDNEERERERQKNNFLNQTVSTVLNKTSTAFTDTLSDLLNRQAGKQMVVHIIEVFTKQERMIYLGIIILAISVFLALIRTDSR